MATITSGLVKELRDKTGAGMMDCKKALIESDGEIETAVDWLRKKGLATAAKKAGRVAADGLVAVAADGSRAAVVEVNAETDFVARNEAFQGFVRTIADLALSVGGDLDALNAADFPGTGRTVADELTHMVATIGENLTLRRVAHCTAPEGGCVATYVHNSVAPGLGKSAVAVALGGGRSEALATLARQLAMHVAAARPEAVSVADVDAGKLDREREILADQARASGKPEEIIAKMVEGRLRKYYEEVVLLEQVFVIDGENRVRQVLETAGKEAGAAVSVSGFVSFRLGEGIDKPAADLAADVAATLGG